MITRVFLVGFMGVGKTTVGQLLARRLGWSFVDLDREIEGREGQSVREIFRSKGEACFRAAEAACLRSVSGPPRRVVSLGGGAYLDPSNRALVDSCGLSVYLEAPLEVLLGRIDDDGSRPLFGSRGQVERLFRERQPTYRMAQRTVETADRAPEDIVDRVVRLLGDI